MCLLCARLVEVREALTQIRRKQALQDSERKGAEQEASLRWAPREVVSGPDKWSWGVPWQGRCPPALGAKLLVDRRPQNPCGHSVGKRDSSPGSPPHPSAVITLTESPALTIPEWGRGGDTRWASGLSRAFTPAGSDPLLCQPMDQSPPPGYRLRPEKDLVSRPPQHPWGPQGPPAGWAAVTCSHYPQAVRADWEAEAGGAGPRGGLRGPAEEPGGGGPEGGP